MNKYTIIYDEWFHVGSQRRSLVTYDRVETNNLRTLIDTEKYNGNIHFIFMGWPTLEGEKS